MRSSVLIAILFAVPAAAQTPGSCTPGVATGRLNVGDVDAGLHVNGNLFYAGSTATDADYRVRGGQGLYGLHLWIGGTIAGDLRITGGAYGQSEMWPGPLGAGGSVPPEGCAPYDRIWVVTTDNVAAYETGGTPTHDLGGWPVGLGAPAVGSGGAPVLPTSREQTIDLAAGERPVIVGSQTAFWVMNDAGNAHARTGTMPLGVEVQVTAAAFRDAGPAFDTATMFRFRVVNRNAQPIDDVRVSIFSDTNLGSFTDDRQGVDLTRAMAYTYNEGSTDPQFGVPPALGIDFLSTLVGAHRYGYNASAGFPTNVPATALGVRRTQMGLWPDGTPQTAFGWGYNTAGEVTLFAFPGDPVVGAFWSMENVDGAGNGQRGSNGRSFTSTPSFELVPGAWMDFDLAIVFGQGADRLDSITRLRAASDLVQAAYDSGMLFPVDGEDGAPSASAFALTPPYPNPMTGFAEFALHLPRPAYARVIVVDVLGRSVAELLDGEMPAGSSELRLDTSQFAAGVYAVVLDVDGRRMARTITVAR